MNFIIRPFDKILDSKYIQNTLVFTNDSFFIIEYNHEVAGLIGLNDIDDKHVWIGLLRAYIPQSMEIMERLITHAIVYLKQMQYDEILTLIDPNNCEKNNLCEKLGFMKINRNTYRYSERVIY